jgi:hypothetical protein
MFSAGVLDGINNKVKVLPSSVVKNTVNARFLYSGVGFK